MWIRTRDKRTVLEGSRLKIHPSLGIALPLAGASQMTWDREVEAQANTRTGLEKGLEVFAKLSSQIHTGEAQSPSAYKHRGGCFYKSTREQVLYENAGMQSMG